jgi:hypothetical protein
LIPLKNPLFLLRRCGGLDGRRLGLSDEEELGAVHDLPLDGLAFLKVQGPCDGDGDGDERALVVAAAADGLDADLVVCHFCKLSS